MAEATSPTIARRDRSLSIESLRRSNAIQSPTRTLHLEELEALERSNSNPRAVTLETLQQRPRSNQRNRTPNRYASPLDPEAFRSVERDPLAPRQHVPRITIRPLAGAAIGTQIATTRIEEQRPLTPKSSKQGPSHRKVRRWNNDHFNKLAAEIGSRRAADALLQAHADAHLYRDIINPGEVQGTINHFLHDKNLQATRDLFYAGELYSSEKTKQPRKNNRDREKKATTAQQMMNRIDTRIRRVVIKACSNSYPAVKVVERLENYLVATFQQWEVLGAEDWWVDLLTQEPQVTAKRDGRLTVSFHFPAESSTGGFHRILLHAIAQFHGLSAVSKMTNTTTIIKARTLIVSGLIEEDKFRLLNEVSGIDNVTL